MILKNNKYVSEITEFLTDLKQNNPEFRVRSTKKERGIMGQAAKKQN